MAVGRVVAVGDEVAVGKAVSVGDEKTVSVGRRVDVNSLGGINVLVEGTGSAVTEIALVSTRLGNSGAGGNKGVEGIIGKGVAMAISIPAVEQRPDKPQQKRMMPAMDEIETQAGRFIAGILPGWI